MVAPDDTGEKKTEEELFRQRWAAWGLRPSEVDGKWNEFLQIEGERFRLEQQGWQKDAIDRAVADFERQVISRRTWRR